ncbi:MAG: saccharopine dehydrogenase NADP-binding domain-containing protein [Bacteroidetes bacterium]|nr:saccharopine dehydrogenase NADP-binding domain-containing protein [Bacteroidota bacterium]
MKKILIIGAGRSTISLINYLLNKSTELNIYITLADIDVNLAKEKIKNHPNACAKAFDIQNQDERRKLIAENEFIISMLPAALHMTVAYDCLHLNKHLATASYVSNEMKTIEKEVKQKSLFFLNECGLDPGIDHASAMKVIDQIKLAGGTITSFKSYCGGLVAPENNTNPWGYKFSWNPRNVVVAGQGTAQFLEDKNLKYLPYSRLFSEHDVIEVPGFKSFDAYANRDSLNYINTYGLHNIETMIRGTLREIGYCNAWQLIINLGLTDDTVVFHETDKLNYEMLLNAFLPNGNDTVKNKLIKFAGKLWSKDVEEKFDYLFFKTNEKITLKSGSPAQLLQSLLERKWKLENNDKDLVVMQHRFEYIQHADSNKKIINSSLVVIGDDNINTAMAKTVGLPLAITVKNFLSGKIQDRGVVIPVTKEIYMPMLDELKLFGIDFKES